MNPTPAVAHRSSASPRNRPPAPSAPRSSQPKPTHGGASSSVFSSGLNDHPFCRTGTQRTTRKLAEPPGGKLGRRHTPANGGHSEGALATKESGEGDSNSPFRNFSGR